MNTHDELIARQVELYRRQARWDGVKILAAMVATGVVFFVGTFAVSRWVHPCPQIITVHVVNDRK